MTLKWRHCFLVLNQAATWLNGWAHGHGDVCKLTCHNVWMTYLQFQPGSEDCQRPSSHIYTNCREEEPQQQQALRNWRIHLGGGSSILSSQSCAAPWAFIRPHPPNAIYSHTAPEKWGQEHQAKSCSSLTLTFQPHAERTASSPQAVTSTTPSQIPQIRWLMWCTRSLPDNCLGWTALLCTCSMLLLLKGIFRSFVSEMSYKTNGHNQYNYVPVKEVIKPSV